MAPFYKWHELARDDGYASSSTAEDGASRCVFHLNGVNADTPPDVDEIGDYAAAICGGVDNLEPQVVSYSDPEGGKVRRRLPKLHPYLPELSVAGVTSIKGEGDQREANSLQVIGVPPITNQFTHYTQYAYLTEFKRRPYFLLPDAAVPRPEATYYKPDGTELRIFYAEEWRRFKSETYAPTPDTVNATTGGQMRFRTTVAALDGTQFPGQVSVYMQNQVLEVTWYMVPYRYFFTFKGCKPYLTRFVNTVNQNRILNFDPGQLLWLGATPTPFMPQQFNTAKFLGLGIAQSQQLLCNVKMRWLVTTRESEDLPAAGTAGLANKNNIAAGHNLQPSFVDRKFHYVTTEDPGAPADTTKWRATFPSFAHELFFTDPMLTQPGGAI